MTPKIKPYLKTSIFLTQVKGAKTMITTRHTTICSTPLSAYKPRSTFEQSSGIAVVKVSQPSGYCLPPAHAEIVLARL